MKKNQCETRCQWAAHGGCAIPENKLDWRGEPKVGKPWECQYLLQPRDQEETACPTVPPTTP